MMAVERRRNCSMRVGVVAMLVGSSDLLGLTEIDGSVGGWCTLVED